MYIHISKSPSVESLKISRMSFKEIRNLKIFQDNKDEILKKAFEEAKYIEKKRASFEFDTVVFKVNYTTNFGEMVREWAYLRV